MILQSLVRYYDILANDPDSGIPTKNYGMVKVSFAVHIDQEGNFIGVLPLSNTIQRGKKEIETAQEMLLFEPVKKASGVNANFLFENSVYFLGLDNKDKPEETKKRFDAFRERSREILANCQCAEAKAVLSFFAKYPMDFFENNPLLEDPLKELLKGGNIIFRVEGYGYAHQSEEIKRAWEAYKDKTGDCVMGQCLITGETAPIARLHPSIKGVRDAQSSGAALVSFNARAYESYGKTEEQGLNAPVGEYAAFKYTTVLNRMLSGRSNRLNLGDTTVVFWAESPDNIHENLMMALLSGDGVGSGEYKKDAETERLIKSVYEKIGQASAIDYQALSLNENTRVSILGIAPNAARLSVRFFHTGMFSGFIDNMAGHYQNLKLEKEFDNQPSAIPLWMIINETAPPKGKDKKPPPLLTGSMMRSILTGANYPDMIYTLIVGRVRADSEIRVNYVRAAIIKAFLLKKYDNIANNNIKGALTMALNAECDHIGYLLGRLFAVLEKAQTDANPGINATINDRYFAAASANPGTVFPTLLKLSQRHMAKSEYGRNSDRRITEIMERIPMGKKAFPARLSLDEQGAFILGYYHQKKDLYTKKQAKVEEAAVNE